MPLFENCRIVKKNRLAAGIFEMWIEAPEISNTVIPGQFVSIKCGEDMVLRRPFGICSAENGLIRIVFELRGKGTLWLSLKNAGESLSVLGPLGNGFSSESGGRILLAAGGIGAAPLLFAASKLLKKTDAALGFRTEAAAILIDEFIVKTEKTSVISDDGSIGERGFVHELCERMLSSGKYSQVWACGPPKMMKAAAYVSGLYNTPCKVLLEERMGCGIGACLVCACAVKSGNGHKYAHVCKDGPVFDAAEVVWDE